MRSLFKIASITAILGLMSFIGLSSDGIPDLKDRLFYDEIGFFSAQEQQRLTQQLEQFAVETSNQFLLFITDDFRGYDKAQFAFELGNKNGVGKRKYDNGLVIVLKPKTRKTRGEIFIATGYGLEGAIPDATANRIIDQEMIPRFKKQDYFGGIAAGLVVLEDLARGEYSYKDYSKKKKKKAVGGIFIVLFVVFIILISRFSKAKRYASTNNLPFWVAMSMLGNSGRSSSGSSFSSFSSGSGGFGGGFGGFGGGSFGGGGAGGSW